MAPVRPRKNMPAHFGIRIVSAEKDKVIGEIDADERHLNNLGIVHGGAYMAFADDLGGTAAGPQHPRAGCGRRRSSRRAISSAPRRPAKSPAFPCRSMSAAAPIVVQTSIFGVDGKLAAMVTQTQLVLPAGMTLDPRLNALRDDLADVRLTPQGLGAALRRGAAGAGHCRAGAGAA